MRGALLLLLCPLLGCSLDDGSRASDGESPHAGSPDASVESESGFPDGAMPATCSALNGTAPFGAQLYGKFSDDAGASRDLALHIFFPEGRQPGKRVAISIDPNRAVASAIIDATGGSGPLVLERKGGCTYRLEANLVGPDGGVRYKIEGVSGPTDVVTPYSATGELCVATPLSPADWRIVGIRLFGSRLSILSATPIDPTTIGGVTVEINGAAVPAKVTVAPTFEVSLTRTPPGGTIVVRTDGVRDLAGRPLPPLNSVTLWGPTETVSDLTFAGAPPSGAIGASVHTVAGGKLTVAPNEAAAHLGLSLSHVPGAVRARVRHRLVCDKNPPNGSVVLIGKSGARVAVPVACGDVATDAIVPLPGDGPYVLIMQSEGAGASECTFPWRIAANGYELDEIEFVRE